MRKLTICLFILAIASVTGAGIVEAELAIQKFNEAHCSRGKGGGQRERRTFLSVFSVTALKM